MNTAVALLNASDQQQYSQKLHTINNMGMIYCKLHGWSGVDLLTHSAAKAVEDPTPRHSIVPVELVFDDVPFFLYALKKELPFERTTSLDQAFEVGDEQALNIILDMLVPRCVKCINEALKGC